MICLNNTDVIEGGASVASVVDYTMNGLIGTTFTQLASGSLTDTLTTVLYTATAGMSIVNIILVNTHSAAVNITLALDPANGGNPRYIIPKTIELGIGYSLHTDGTKFTVANEKGEVAMSIPSHTIASHSDTSGTGAELDELTGGGDTTLHDHDGITDEGVSTTAGAFTSSITGLGASTIYGVRAYATNADGTEYGEVKYFKTQGAPG